MDSTDPSLRETVLKLRKKCGFTRRISSSCCPQWLLFFRNFCPVLKSMQWASAAVFFKWKQKIKTSCKWREFGLKADICDREFYDANTNSIMWCCRYVDRCPSLLCDIFDLPLLTSTYRCSHLSKNGGSKVLHLILSSFTAENYYNI